MGLGLPLDSVLGTMVDHAIAVTDADRGLLLDADASGSLCVRLVRGTGGARLLPESLAPSKTALRLALERESRVITEDLNLSDFELQVAPLGPIPRESSNLSIVFSASTRGSVVTPPCFLAS